jgi:hypothetical protein
MIYATHAIPRERNGPAAKRSPMIRLVQIAAALAILAFWLHSMNEALRMEQYVSPKDIRVGRGSYEILLARSLERDPVQHVGIYQGAKCVGHSYTEIRHLNTRFLIKNETSFSPNLLVTSVPTNAKTEIRIGPDFLIEHFSCDLVVASQQMRVHFEGQADGADLVVTATVPWGETRTTRVSRELTIFHGFSPFVGMPQLDVGEEWNIQGLDLSMLAGSGVNEGVLRPRILTAKVVGRETLDWEGKPVEVFVAEVPEQASDALKRRARAWIAADGRILQEEHRILHWTFLFKREPPPTRPGWRVW